MLTDFGGHKRARSLLCFPQAQGGQPAAQPWSRAVAALSDWGNAIYTAVIQMYAGDLLAKASMQNQEKVGDFLEACLGWASLILAGHPTMQHYDLKAVSPFHMLDGEHSPDGDLQG